MVSTHLNLLKLKLSTCILVVRLKNQFMQRIYKKVVVYSLNKSNNLCHL